MSISIYNKLSQDKSDRVMPPFANHSKTKWTHKKSLRTSKNNSYSNIYKSLKFSGLKTDVNKNKKQGSVFKPTQRKINLETKTEFNIKDVLTKQTKKNLSKKQPKTLQKHKRSFLNKKPHTQRKATFSKSSANNWKKQEIEPEKNWKISRVIGQMILSTRATQFDPQIQRNKLGNFDGLKPANRSEMRAESVGSKSRARLRKLGKRLVARQKRAKKAKIEARSVDKNAEAVWMRLGGFGDRKASVENVSKWRNLEFLEHKKETKREKIWMQKSKQSSHLLKKLKRKSKNFSASTFNLSKQNKHKKRFISRTPGILKQKLENRKFLTMLDSKSRNLSPMNPFKLNQKIKELHLPKSHGKTPANRDFSIQMNRFEFFPTSKKGF